MNKNKISLCGALFYPLAVLILLAFGKVWIILAELTYDQLPRQTDGSFYVDSTAYWAVLLTPGNWAIYSILVICGIDLIIRHIGCRGVSVSSVTLTLMALIALSLVESLLENKLAFNGVRASDLGSWHTYYSIVIVTALFIGVITKNIVQLRRAQTTH